MGMVQSAFNAWFGGASGTIASAQQASMVVLKSEINKLNRLRTKFTNRVGETFQEINDDVFEELGLIGIRATNTVTTLLACSGIFLTSISYLVFGVYSAMKTPTSMDMTIYGSFAGVQQQGQTGQYVALTGGAKYKSIKKNKKYGKKKQTKKGKKAMKKVSKKGKKALKKSKKTRKVERKPKKGKKYSTRRK